VVDELHTFDGAQGADVACLIRRLKERLRTAPGSLICVGTSATLGNTVGGSPAGNPAADRTAELVRYATKVFGEKFEAGSVVGETLQPADQFLGKLVQWFAVPGLEEKEKLNPLAYRNQIDYVRAQHQIWFGDQGHLSGPGTDEWNLALGERLRSHLFLRNLLVLMDGRAVDVNDLLRLIQARIPGFGKKEDGEYVAWLLSSFLSLVSEARTGGQPGEPLLPFLQVRYQFWARELARVVSSVARTPQWRLAGDLKTEELRRSLPIVHCRECGLTGWAGTVKDLEQRVNPDLDTFYKAYFDFKPEARFLFPGEGIGLSLQMELPQFLCPNCLHFERMTDPRDCSNCGKPAGDMIRVWVPDMNVRQERRGGARIRSEHICPACGGQDSLTIVGSRAASLTAVMIAQLYGSPFNSDKKLLAFSDNVQDASHRAGFFKARTFTFNLRSAIQKTVEDAGGTVALSDIAGRFDAYWSQRLVRAEQMIATFLPTDMEWLEDYEYMRRENALPAGSNLRDLVRKRLDWEIWSEYTLDCRVGRTLEKSGCSTVEVSPTLVESAAESILLRLQNELGGLRSLDALTLLRFLQGFLVNLKNRGAVEQAEVPRFLRAGAETYALG